MSKYLETLAQEINKKRVILFVGSGVSSTVGLPTWSELIHKMSLDLNIEPEIFELYGNFLSLAEYYEIEKKSLRSLLEWMKQNWTVSEDKIKDSKIYNYIKDLKFKIIYTTNYDHILEDSFRLGRIKRIPIITLSNLLDISDDSIQIIKFHGDIDKISSIVLTESSYFDRLNFESALDIKFRSDCLGRSLLFIGYSFNDINLRYLIYKLNSLWNMSPDIQNRPKSYIFMGKPNPIQQKIFEKRNITPITSEEIDETKGLEKFLETLLAECEKDSTNSN